MKHLILGPVVFLAGEHYDIVWTTYEKGAAWVEVGGKKYYDTITGIVRSDDTVHKVSVPQSELDKARKYEVSFLQVFERKAYFPITAEVAESKKYDFHSVVENPNIMIRAHEHIIKYFSPKSTFFGKGEIGFPVFVGSIFDEEWKRDICVLNDFAGTAVNFENDGLHLRVTGPEKNVIEQKTVQYASINVFNKAYYN